MFGHIDISCYLANCINKEDEDGDKGKEQQKGDDHYNIVVLSKAAKTK